MFISLSCFHPSLSDMRLSSNVIAMAGLGEVWKASSRSLSSPAFPGRKINRRADSKLPLPRFLATELGRINTSLSTVRQKWNKGKEWKSSHNAMTRSNPDVLFYSHHENYSQSQCKLGHLSNQVCELKLIGIWHAVVLEHTGMDQYRLLL